MRDANNLVPRIRKAIEDTRDFLKGHAWASPRMVSALEVALVDLDTISEEESRADEMEAELVRHGIIKPTSMQHALGPVGWLVEGDDHLGLQQFHPAHSSRRYDKSQGRWTPLYADPNGEIERLRKALESVKANIPVGSEGYRIAIEALES